MVEKEKVFIQVTPTKRLLLERVSIDGNDSSPEAVAALKRILKDSDEVIRQIYAPLDDVIDTGNAVKKARLMGNKNSKEPKAKLKALIDARVLGIIENWELKKIESPSWREIKQIYEVNFAPVTISRSRIYAAKRANSSYLLSKKSNTLP